MELTKVERLILFNQYTILKSLDDNSETYDDFIEILEKGFKSEYSKFFQWMDDDMPAEEAELVISVLDMYRRIEEYKRDNSNKEDGVDKHFHSKFLGFDEHSEVKYLVFTRFLIIKQGGYKELVENDYDDFSSSMPYLDKYQAMVNVWKGMDINEALTHDQVMKILNAE